MNVENPPISERLHEFEKLAISIGWGVADLLKEARRHHFEIGGEQDSPVTSADLAANDYILSHLQFQLGHTDFAYLSEETFKAQDPRERLGKDWVWIIDPLDGTKDYIQDTGEYATQIALTFQGRPIVAVVACPGVDRLYSAVKGQGSWVHTPGQTARPVRVSSQSNLSEMTIVTSRNHLSEKLKDLIKSLNISTQKGIGSVGYKVSTLVEQGADLYISISGNTAPKDWDFAAPELILTEASGRLTYFDGRLIHYNREDVNQWTPILASNDTQHDFICKTAQAFLAQYP